MQFKLNFESPDYQKETVEDNKENENSLDYISEDLLSDLYDGNDNNDNKNMYNK